jgi:hypothetical protein
MTKSPALISFNEGVAYETVREILNFEIAAHMAVIYKIKDERDPRTLAHRVAVRNLQQVQHDLNPKDTQQIALVLRLLESIIDRCTHSKGGTRAA